MVKVICVGLGSRGQRWVEWAKESGADVIGVVDAHEETLAVKGEDLGFKADRRFTSIGEAAERLKPEAAVVCTPNFAHAAAARDCLENGLHLFIEKPLAEHMDIAKELVESAEQRGLQLSVAQQYRYEPPMKKLREMVQQAKIGKLTNGLVEFYRWRPTNGIQLPLLLNQSVHHFDVIRAIFNSTPVSCTADMWNPEWNGCDGPTVAEATFTFADGNRIHYSGSYVAKGKITPFNALWRLEGSTGQITYDGEAEIILTRADDGQHQLHEIPADRTSSIIAVCRDFLRAVKSGTPSPTSGRDNLETLAMVFAIEKSAAERREVQIAELLN